MKLLEMDNLRSPPQRILTPSFAPEVRSTVKEANVGFLGDIGRVAGGFLLGGPAGAIAAGVSVLARGKPAGTPQIQIRPPIPGGHNVVPWAGGAIASADSVIASRGPFGTSNRVGVYGPRFQIGGGYGAGGSGGVPVGGGGGGMVQYQVPSCPMPVGRGRVAIMPSPCAGYHWNRGRYYVFGDCRTGSYAGTVEPGERLVRNRRINPANAKAAYRAARRLNGTVTLLRKIERVTRKLVGGSKSRTGRSSGCGKCKGACKCK